MFRFLTRIGVLGTAAAALALSGTALANPSTPTLAVQPYVTAFNVSWSPSTPDPGAALLSYRSQCSTDQGRHDLEPPGQLPRRATFRGRP